MTKAITFSLILSFLCVNTYAQNYSVSSIIGDDNDYWSGAYIYEFIALNGNLSDPQDLPFAFQFYGQTVSSYRISENGYITFNAPSGVSIDNNTSLPNTGGPNNAIYALWDDFTAASVISTKTYGEAPNRAHVITWAGLNYPGAANWQDDLTVSLFLYENCLDFEVVIIENSILPSSSFYSMINTTIGCENASGTVGAEVSGSPNFIPTDPSWDEELYEVYRFSWNTPVSNDASLIALSIDNHLPAGNHTLKGFVRNEGEANLTSYDINYSLNGGAVQTTSINGINASNSQKNAWEHNTPINIAGNNDSYELKVWVSNVNGNQDAMACNDTLVEYITGFQNTSGTRKVLVEEFTGTWCGYCIDGAVYLDDLESQHGDDLVTVAIHDGDPMEFDEGLRQAFSVTAYPNAVINRKNDDSGDTYEAEPVGRGSWPSRVANQMYDFTPLDLSINHTWDSTTRTIDATVTADYLDNSAGDARIVLMIVEDSLTGTDPDWDQANNYDNTTGHPYYGAGGSVVGFVHRHVLRAYVEGDAFGVDNVIPHFVNAGANYQHDFQYTLPVEFDANQIYLVAAVVRYNSTNDPMYIGMRGQRYVYNVEEVHLMDENPITTDVLVKTNQEILTVFPNPTSGLVQVQFENYSGNKTLEVYNAAGQFLQSSHANTVDLSEYPAGLYLLRVSYADNIKQFKIIKSN